MVVAPMSRRDLSWRERGVLDFKDGVPREEGPFPAATPEGKDWLAGYDEAAESHEETAGTLEMIGAQIVFDGTRLFLTDGRGRVIGTQAHIAIEQEDGQKTVNATVTLMGLKLVLAP